MVIDEVRRLAALKDYRVLDTPPEDMFDNITRLATTLLETPIALVSLIDERRQWFKSRVGLGASETPREFAFCHHAIRGTSTMVVEDATEDPRFASNPLVTGDPFVRFYCGVPLRSPDGNALGTLCIIDRVKRAISLSDRAVLESLARQVEGELELRRRNLMLEEALQTHQTHQKSKELLASMLVHDLRSPLTAIALIASGIRQSDPEVQRDLTDLQEEANRARRMLSDVLDICLHSLGELRLRRGAFDLNELVKGVCRRMSHRGRLRQQTVVVDAGPEPLTIDADPELIGRVVENLISNAMHHGPSARPITVSVLGLEGQTVRVSVRDEGNPIAPERAASLFRTFETTNSRNLTDEQRHYGLGLSFCLLAVEAHGGVIGLTPADGSNCFSFELPAGPTPRA